MRVQATADVAMNAALFALRVLNTVSSRAKAAGVPSHTPAVASTGASDEAQKTAAVLTPMPGRFLVAHPLLGGRWYRNVIFMLHNDGNASMGVVVNSGVSVGLFKEAVTKKAVAEGFDKVRACVCGDISCALRGWSPSRQ